MAQESCHLNHAHETSASPRRDSLRGASRWLLVIVLSVIAACLLIEVGFATSAATAQSIGPAAGPAGKAGVFAVPAQITRDTYGVYLVDADNGTIAVYEFSAAGVGGRKLRLLAARNYSFDLQLDDYNTEPLPRDIKALVEQHKRLSTSAPN